MNGSMAGQDHRHTAIAAAVIVLTMGAPTAASAQQAGAPEEAGMQQVVVTGVRAALEQSLRQKRNAASVVEVVTAADIGKMPDKNVADAIQRLPGTMWKAAWYMP